jgi:hypothetical protein
MFRIAFLVLVLFSAGCHSTGARFLPTLHDARTASGQIRYAGHGRSIIGELYLAQTANAGRMEFSKTAGVLLIRVFWDQTHWRFEGPLARGAGEIPRSARIPSHLVVWAKLATRGLKNGRGEFSHAGEEVAFHVNTLR